MSDRRQTSADISGADSMPNESECRETADDKTGHLKHKRRVQAYLPSIEMKEEFVADAEERGGVSKFTTYLYRRYKRGQLEQPDEKRAA